MNKHNNLKQAKILFNTLLKAKLDSSPDYKIYEKCFLPVILSLDGGVNRILESFKLDVMQGEHEACYILSEVYKIDFYSDSKDEYMTNLLILIGHKLANRECTKMVQSNPAEYEIFEDVANSFIDNYIRGDKSISFDDVILLAHLSYDDINQSSSMLIGSDFSEV